MNRLLCALAASALLAAPSLASADQMAAATAVAPTTHQYQVVDNAGNVVGDLLAVNALDPSVRIIGYVQVSANADTQKTVVPEHRLLTSIDFNQLWDEQLQAISAPPAGGS
jgi:hypothetical protein